MKLALHILVAALLLAGCGNAPDDDAEQDVPGFAANGRRDLIGLAIDTAGRKAGKSYIEYAVDRDRDGNGLTFAEYGCTSDCEETRRGYEHARSAAIRQPALCASLNNWAAVEGCVAFTQGLSPTTAKAPPLEAQS